MVRLLYDFADQETRARYPEHGWARNSQGHKLLWFPIISLAAQVEAVRQVKGAQVRFRSIDVVRHRPLGQKLHSLLVVLRELHRLKRIGEAVRPGDIQGELEAFSQYRDLAPVYLDAYYTYLRRIADSLTQALIPVLFDDYLAIQKSDFRAIRKQVTGNTVPASRYLCDRVALAAAFYNHSTWYDVLTTEGTKGMRDALEHESASWLDVGMGGPIDSVRMQAHLWKGNGIITTLGDLIERIHNVNNDFCLFCTEVHAAVGWGEGYHVGRGNVVYHLFGEDEDVVGFWPII